MLIALLLAAATPAQDKALEADPTFQAYRDWRICLDSRLGRPPRPPRGRAEIEDAFSACRVQEEALGAAARAKFSPVAGAGIFEGLSKSIRAEYGAGPSPH
jgi:hypothetical protein